MATHARERNPIQWGRIIGALLIGIGVGLLIGLNVMPHETTTIINHIGTALKPNSGRMIANMPKVKAKALTLAQLHAHHLHHIAHLIYLHTQHVQHLQHVQHVAVMHSYTAPMNTNALASSFREAIR